MRCNSCGCVFDATDAITVKEDYGETFTACPECRDTDLDETECCDICEEEKDPSMISNGLCVQCLWDRIDYMTTLDYLKENHLLADFILCEWFHAGGDVEANEELEAFLEESFRRFAANDLLLLELKRNKDQPFLLACKKYCLPGYPVRMGLCDTGFAEWYAKRMSSYNKTQEDKQG